nr:nuclear transport factor 2 family protein [Sphingomonas sp. CDS-1]
MELVEKLAAIEYIRQLKARYWRAIDSRSWDVWRECFTQDVRFEFPELDSSSSADEFIPWTMEFLEGSNSIHRGYAPEIEITSDTMATGIWAFEDRIYWSPDKPNNSGLATLQGDGHYHDRYRKEDGKWKISSTQVVRQRITTTAHKLSLPK